MSTEITPRHQAESIVQMRVSALMDTMATGAMVPVDAPTVPLATSFDPLDKSLEGGLRRGDLSIVGGMPGVGKTIATLQWAAQMARVGNRVLYLCYEHDVPTLFGRLLSAESGALVSTPSAADVDQIKEAVDSVMRAEWDPGAVCSTHPVVRGAMAQIEGFSDRLVLAQLAADNAHLGMIKSLVENASPSFDVVFVDYLQKVPAPGLHGLDRFTSTVEGLKNTALANHCHVVAVSAVGEGALEERRLHLEGLRGAHVLAHEADVIITLNQKLRVVAKAHLAFDSTLHDRFARTVVFTIEKNRRGLAPLDLEFDKDFSHYRFDPRGRFVAERLVDGFVLDE